METRYYSKTTGSTYLRSVHLEMPVDVIPITEERYLAVIGNSVPGKVRSHDGKGLPILVDPVQPSVGEQCETLYQVQYAAINLACEAEITGGFASDALGSLHTYSSKIEDQLNLTGIIQAELDSPYSCRDEQGVKAYRPHTAAQLRQVGDDFTVFKLRLLKKASDLKARLEQALVDCDLAALEAVTWGSEWP